MMNIFNTLKKKRAQINRVNVGCGPEARDGWINVDIQKFSSVDRIMDVTKSWPFKDLDYVYAEHFIEHIEIDLGIDFLVNAGKSLKNGGWIRLSTPNIEWMLKTHYKWGQLHNPDIAFKSVSAVNRAFYGWGHKFIYSPWLLEKILIEIGFDNIRFCEYGESEIETFENIEKHGGYFVADESPSVIIIEAQKQSTVNYPNELYELINENFIRYSRAKG